MRIVISLKSVSWIDPPKFAKQIADAGYGARKEEVRLTVVGTVERDGDRLVLTLPEMKPPIRLLLSATGLKDKAAAATATEAIKLLEQNVGKLVEVEGMWIPADKGAGPLALQRLAPVKFSEHAKDPVPKAGT